MLCGCRLIPYSLTPMPLSEGEGSGMLCGRRLIRITASPPCPSPRERGVECSADVDSSLTASPPCPSPRERGVECSADVMCSCLSFLSLSSISLIFIILFLLFCFCYCSFLYSFAFSTFFIVYPNISLPSPLERGLGGEAAYSIPNIFLSLSKVFPVSNRTSSLVNLTTSNPMWLRSSVLRASSSICCRSAW
jgi:hypothetical protein